MPKAFPIEFRRDVVAVARKGEAPLSQIAKDFGISESCLHRWLKLADIEDGVRPGVTAASPRSCGSCGSGTRRWSRRTRFCGGPRRSSPGRPPKMMYPLVLDLAADGNPVAVTCRVLGFSKQAFYAWRKDPVSQRDWDDAHLINAALDIHADDPAFGYRFIADELPARGIEAGENRVERLCSLQGIWSVFAKKRGLTARPARRSTTTWSAGISPPTARTALADRHHRTPHR